MENELCIHCGRSRAEIKKNKYFCATVTYEGEVDYEWPRHRFTPLSAKEQAAKDRDEAEYLKQMDGMADFMRTHDIIVKELKDAWYIEGVNPAYHREQRQLLKKNWPALYKAITNLV